MSQSLSYFELTKMNILKQDLEQKNGYQLPDIFKQYALTWNSKILIPNDLKQFSYCLGFFLSTIIKLSKNSQVQVDFKSIYDSTLQQLDQKLDLLEQLVNYIFDVTEIVGIPTSPQFQQIALKLFENFEFFKQTTDKLSQFYYFNGQLISQPNEQTNYRLIIFQQQNGAIAIQFSTNLNPVQLYWTNFKSGFRFSAPINPIPPNNNQINQKINVIQKTNFPPQQINNTNIQGFKIPQSQSFQQPQIQQILQENPQQFNLKNNQISQCLIKPEVQPLIKDSIQQNLNTSIRQTSPVIQDKQNEVENVMNTHYANTQIQEQPSGESQRFQTTLIIKNKKTQVCEVCSVEYDQNNEGILSPCCERKFHKECYLNDLFHKAEYFNNFDALSCFGCKKQLKEYKEFLKASLGQKLLPLITTEIIKNIPNNCFKCQLPIAINQQQPTRQLIKCTRCQTEICRLCKQQYHGENEQSQQCPSLHQEIIKSMAGMVITICPFCNLIQTKDDKCNHVKCSKCKKDLCAICSVDRRPIVGHGNHFHREGCVDYVPWLDKNKKKVVEKKNNKCELCKETGNVCEYPKTLKEYKAEKQY